MNKTLFLAKNTVRSENQRKHTKNRMNHTIQNFTCWFTIKATYTELQRFSLYFENYTGYI